MIVNCVSSSLRKMFKLDAHLFGRYFLHLTDMSAYLGGRDQAKKGRSERWGEGELGQHCGNLKYIISIILSDYSKN